MYQEKMKPILEDLENKEIEVAGGSVVGMVLATVNSLIMYISNMTLGKKKYEDVQAEVQKVLVEAEKLKLNSMQVIDEDKNVLEKILQSYKLKNDFPKKYEDTCKDAVDFCMKVLHIAFDTLKLADRISKIGNRMLSSDFKICKYYAFASVKSAIVNVDINLNAITDEEFKKNVNLKCNEILKESERICEICKFYKEKK